MEKSNLRKQILQERSALNPKQRQIWDKEIWYKLVQLDEENPYDVYLCYVNFRSEVNTTEFIDWCLLHNKKVYVPKVFQMEEMKYMDFYRIQSISELEKGYQGILEPIALEENKISEAITKTNGCRMILPGAVFDEERNRIGYGGGFYDRYLSMNEEHFQMETIGLCYRMQIVKKIPTESFDRKVQRVVHN